MTRVRIENVVASSSMGSDLDLNAIALKLDGAEYAPDEFPGLIYRQTKPKTAVLLFHSGKVVCTGGKSWKEADDSIRAVAALIRKSGQKVVAHPKIEVQNIVATSNLDSEINLNSIAIALGLDRVEYEPEQFPGLVYRVDEPRVVVLLFGSGKLVCTGARKPSDVMLAVEHVKGELQRAGLLPDARAPAKPAASRASPSPAAPARVSRAEPRVPAPEVASSAASSALPA